MYKLSFRATSTIMRAIVLAVVASFTVQLTLLPVTAASFGRQAALQGNEVVIPDGTEFSVALLPKKYPARQPMKMIRSTSRFRRT